MKGLIYSAVALTGFLGFVAVTAAQAQMVDRMRFTTSFPFTVGKTHFTPGNYLVGPADDMNDGVLRISNGRQAAFMVVIPEGVPRDVPKDNALTFERLGDSYVLTQIWDATEKTAVEPSDTASLLRREAPRMHEAERITIPFVKVS